MKDNLLKSMKTVRDEDVHEKPIAPRQNVTALVDGVVSAAEAAEAVVRDSAGNIISRTSSAPRQPRNVPEEKASVKYDYYFNDWADKGEDVFCVCDRYLSALENVITAGARKK